MTQVVSKRAHVWERPRRGLSLVELLVVIAIIAILFSILLVTAARVIRAVQSLRGG
jgi:prepilin-type N-terminal cleavage/methylation domain-containing protein